MDINIRIKQLIEWNSNDYVDVEWISDEYEKLEVTSCTVCREPYETVVENDKVYSNLTVDRLDNSKAHTKDNIRICCVTCNVTKGNRY